VRAGDRVGFALCEEAEEEPLLEGFSLESARSGATGWIEEDVFEEETCSWEVALAEVDVGAEEVVFEDPFGFDGVEGEAGFDGDEGVAVGVVFAEELVGEGFGEDGGVGGDVLVEEW